MKHTISFLFCVLFVMATQAQGNKAAVKLKEVITLRIKGKGGANGASVAWHPVLKKYYAAMAGNVSYPMAVYDAKGALLSPDTMITNADLRGLWYNPIAKTLQGNCYDDGGLVEYSLEKNGLLASVKSISYEEVYMPSPQCVGAFDAKKQRIWAFDIFASEAKAINMDGLFEARSLLYIGYSAYADTASHTVLHVLDDYNENALVYTAVPKQEIGLLNVKEHRIELYDLATGLMAKQLILPIGAPMERSLNFSYTNGIYWLFDKKERIWHGYK